MRFLITLLALIPIVVLAGKKPIVVAVIDTGMPVKTSASLCQSGHTDFTGYGLEDRNDHGSHIMDVIDQYASNSVVDKNGKRPSRSSVNYCIVVIKYWDNGSTSHEVNAINLTKSINYATSIKADIINISSGGEVKIESERTAILKALDLGIKIVVSAGNSGALQRSLGESYVGYYPAMYDRRLIVVGSVGLNGKNEPYSNTGPHVNALERGTSVVGRDRNWNLVWMTGTSQAAAIRTGKIVRYISRKP